MDHVCSSLRQVGSACGLCQDVMPVKSHALVGFSAQKGLRGRSPAPRRPRICAAHRVAKMACWPAGLPQTQVRLAGIRQGSLIGRAPQMRFIVTQVGLQE